ncbi:hypothetical protein Ndes2526B_g09281 [Nannochloris sp. 'desiccata']
MLSSTSRAAQALRQLLLNGHPSPAGGLPGYLRAFVAEAASFQNSAFPAAESANAASAAAAASAAMHEQQQQFQDEDEQAKQAYANLVQTIFSQAVQQAQDGPHTFAYEGLQVLEEQERAAEAAADAASPSPAILPHISRTLTAMRYHQRMMDGTPKGRKLQENWQRQIILETRAVEAALARYRREAASMVERNQGATLPAARKLLVSWFQPLADAIRAEQLRVAKGVSGVDRCVYGPYLMRLDPEQLAVIAMHAAVNAFMSPESDAEAIGSAPGTTRMTRLAVAIGSAVQAQHHVNKLEKVTHQQNMRRREIRQAYEEGKLLRKRYDEEGELDSESWAKWFDIGKRLRTGGEMLPLDHLEWFLDDDLEARLRKSAQQFKVPAGASDNEMRLILQRARRMLADSSSSGEWRSDMQAKVGVILIKLMMDACKIDVNRDGRLQTVPAFWHALEQGPDSRARGIWKRYGILYADEEVMRRIKPHHMAEAFMPQFLPTVVTPVPWQRHNLGGYLTLRSSVMRMRGSHAQKDKLQEADKEMVEGRGEGLSLVYDALNALGETPWSINQDVYKVVEAVWAWGGGICDVPQRDNVDAPKLLEYGFNMKRTDGGNLALFSYPRSEVKQRQYEASRARKKNNELHSLRCDMEYKLAIAREFSREERFYFPHNVDFRGRAYPMHPHLNHLGSDMCRGLLQFADDRPLGPNGLRWLYIQAANLWGGGVDKLPLEGRIKWVEDNLGLILDNATDPFRKPPGSDPSFGNLSSGNTINTHLGEGGGGGGHREEEDGHGVDDRGHVLLQSLLSETSDLSTPYWYRAEAPFQFLATCFDIYRALASGDPPAYRSRLPVHQDGSCNGLQHYAALGRDLTGGWAVNLCPVERPQDVYTEISRMVKEQVDRDAAAGVPEAQTLLASTAVDRKLVKQTVMTSVYGVTFVGARAQIGSRLRERGFEDNHAMYKVSCYSARVTLDCLHEMFQSAKHIMQWLSECARLIARENRSVGWTTPMGLPVIQPYRKKSQQHVRTVLQRLVLANDQDDKPVMKQRQRTAFPPNYIHSIDSSHMMLTAIACRDAGLDFAGVHDSFWTHAGTVEQMNHVLREKFIDLHSQPLLENLLEELGKEHPDIVFPPLPPRGDLHLEDIKLAKYFFS